MLINVVSVTHAVKTYEEVEVQLHLLLTSALDGAECSAHAPVAVESS